jgi:hypothetical protein
MSFVGYELKIAFIPSCANSFAASNQRKNDDVDPTQ